VYLSRVLSVCACTLSKTRLLIENFTQIDRVRDGVTVSEELLVDGQAVVVTKDNLHSFIHRKANYKLNIETSEQSR
jgi:hypothetical protein